MVNIDHLNKKTESDLFLLDKNVWFKDKLGYKIYKNGLIFTSNERGGATAQSVGVWKNKNEYDLTTGRCAIIEFKWNDKRKIPNDTVFAKSSEKVIYIGCLAKPWGHFITDSLRCFWFLKSNMFEKFKDYKLVYTTWGGFKLTGNHKQLLSLLGLNDSNIFEIKNPTQFSEIIVPDASFATNYSTGRIIIGKEYKDTINEIVKSFEKIDFKTKYNHSTNIYFSCRFNDYGRFTGEKKLEYFFKKHGFTIIHPECCSFYDQLDMLTKAKCFASTDGSSSHNSIFVGEGSTLIIIPRAHYHTSYQASINYLNNYNCFYIDATMSFLCHKDKDGPYYFYISSELLTFFNEKNNKKYNKINFKDFKDYFKKGLFEHSNFTFNAEYYINDLLHHLSKYYEHKRLSYFLFRIKRKIKTTFLKPKR